MLTASDAKAVSEEFPHSYVLRFYSRMRYFSKGVEYVLLCTKALSVSCRLSFRIVLSRGLLKITCSQYTLGLIFDSFFAGVVYGASLICCIVVPYGVIRRWQRICLCISSHFYQRTAFIRKMCDDDLISQSVLYLYRQQQKEIISCEKANNLFVLSNANRRNNMVL